MKPGFYSGLAMRDYLALPALSAGLLHAIDTRCPKAAWHDSWLNPKRVVDDGGAAQDTGTVAHCLLLERNADLVVIVDAKDWRTTKAQEQRDAARAAGKIALLPHQMPKITAMVAAADEYIESLKDTEPAIWAAFQPGGGESEAVIVWEERDGTICKIRPDRISTGRLVTIDVKTTLASAEPETWARRTSAALGYPLASAFYRRGIKAQCGVDTTYVWLVIEQDAPHLCSLVGLDNPGIALADRKADLARKTWAACVASGRWRGYPTSVIRPETPPYEFNRAEEKHGVPFDYETLLGKKYDETVDSMS